MSPDPRSNTEHDDEASTAEDAGITIRPIHADELDDYLDALLHETHCPQD